MTKPHNITLDIGDIPIVLQTDNAEFARMVEHRYGPFVNPQAGPAAMELDVKLLPSPDGWRWDEGLEERGAGYAESSDDDVAAALLDPDDDVKVSLALGLWTMQRGDFHAEWDPATRRGWVQQTINPYSIDGVLRILHSLVLAREGGLLIHGASAVRNGRAFIFAGISGTGKTTISRLAPPDVKLLTDEISYVRDMAFGTQDSGLGNQDSGYGTLRSQIQDFKSSSPNPDALISNSNSPNPDSRVSSLDSPALSPDSRVPIPCSPAPNPELLTPSPESVIIPSPESRAPSPYHAYGTPFAGELAKIGEKLKVPLAGLFLLKQGPENRIEQPSEAEAVRELMRHILFFAHDSTLVNMVFETVCQFVRRVPVQRLVFKKDASVWDLIG